VDILLFIGAVVSLAGIVRLNFGFDKIAFNLVFLGGGIGALSPMFKEFFKMILNPDGIPMPESYSYLVDIFMLFAPTLFILSSSINIYATYKKEEKSF
jgi:hypothetical protein